MGDHERAQRHVPTVEGGIGVGGERERAELTPESGVGQRAGAEGTRGGQPWSRVHVWAKEEAAPG